MDCETDEKPEEVAKEESPLNTGKTGVPDFELLVTHLGQFGPFQRWLYFALWIPAASMAIGIYASVFLEFIPNFHCSSTCLRDAPALALKVKDSACTIPNSWINGSDCTYVTEEVTPCQEFAYDQTMFTRTVITDFNAVCDQSYLKTVSSTVYMSGMLFGSFIFGWISDSFGRRTAFTLGILALSIGSTLGAFSTNYYMYMAFRFVTSMGGMASFMTSFVLATEFVGTKYRTLCGILIEIPFALGELYLCFLAYFIRDWQILQLVVGVPFFLVLLYLIKLPESVRWAWAVGKTDVANKVIRAMAEFNKTPLPDQFIMNKSKMKSSEDPDEADQKAQVGLAALIVSRPLRGRLVVMALNWIVATLCFYGLSLNAGIGSDVFSVFSLAATMEIPGYIFCAATIGYWGRKPFLIFVQLLCGASCIMAGTFDDSTSRLVFSLIGKFGSSAAFAVVFLYTAELFPTSMRNSSIGICSTLARIGGILAPSVAELGVKHPQAPFLIFGFATILGGLGAFLLPETNGKKLPDTVQEAVEMKHAAVQC